MTSAKNRDSSKGYNDIYQINTKSNEMWALKQTSNDFLTSQWVTAFMEIKSNEILKSSRSCHAYVYYHRIIEFVVRPSCIMQLFLFCTWKVLEPQAKTVTCHSREKSSGGPTVYYFFFNVVIWTQQRIVSFCIIYARLSGDRMVSCHFSQLTYGSWPIFNLSAFHKLVWGWPANPG